jgi:hypothetical protein
MMSRFRPLAGAIVGLALVLGGCGLGAQGGDPSASLREALEAAEADGLATVGEFTCAAAGDRLGDLLSSDSFATFEAAGVDPAEVLDAAIVQFEDLELVETERDGDRATVEATGTMTIDLDADKMRAIVATMLAAQGLTPDDAMLDQVMGQLEGQLRQSQPFDETFALVHEDGRWLVC